MASRPRAVQARWTHPGTWKQESDNNPGLPLLSPRAIANIAN